LIFYISKERFPNGELLIELYLPIFVKLSFDRY